MKTILKQYLKFNKWWVYKIGSGVFTFTLFKYLQCGSLHPDCLKFQDLILFFVLILLAVLGHFINDWSDYDTDRQAGKSNVFQVISYKAAIPILFLLSVGIFGLTLCFLPLVILPLVVLQMGCCVLYSVEPFRLKEKGFVSVILTGIYERSLPYLIILLSIGTFSNEITCLAVLYLWWSYLWECRNFINGQVADFEEDLKSGTRSIAVSAGLEKTCRIKSKLEILEITALLAWLSFLIVEKSWFFIGLTLLILLIHGSLNTGARLLKSKESFLDYLYNYAFLAGLMLSLLISGKINLWWALFVLFLFHGAYSKSTFWVIYNHVMRFVWKFYYGVRYVASKLVNYSIYYFRKYVLQWSDAKSRGEKD